MFSNRSVKKYQQICRQSLHAQPMQEEEMTQEVANIDGSVLQNFWQAGHFSPQFVRQMSLQSEHAVWLECHKKRSEENLTTGAAADTHDE